MMDAVQVGCVVSLCLEFVKLHVSEVICCGITVNAMPRTNNNTSKGVKEGKHAQNYRGVFEERRRTSIQITHLL